MIRHPLADAIFWIGAASCVIAQVAILRSALRAPMTTPATDALPRQRRVVEVAWTIVPALALAILLTLTWRAIHTARGTDRTGMPDRITAVMSGARTRA